MPFEAGCALIRDREAQQAAFAMQASYLASAGRGIAPTPLLFSGLGLDLSRGFRALKVWMSLKTHGREMFAHLIEQNIEQADYLAERIQAEPHLELLAPVPLNVACFRYVVPGLEAAALDALNQEILLRLQESGVAVPSSTRIHGRFALRVAITNHRSRREDFDILVEAVKQHGAELASATP
jgi:aromatic-L-amino-acid/L-tryptophan decarboxylase